MTSLIIALLAAVTLPSLARAQDTVAVVPSIALAELTDSNVFSTTSPYESDVFRRMSPGLRVDVRSPLWLLSSGYTMDVERYQRHTELDDAVARQQADVTFRYTGQRVTFANAALFLTTHTPQELNVGTGTGLAVQRGAATDVSVLPSLLYRLSERTRLSADMQYDWTTFTAVDAIASRTSSIVTAGINLGLERRRSPTTKVLARYEARSFTFGGSAALFGQRSESFNAVMLGLTHDLTRSLGMTVLAGPRLSDGTVRPQVSLEVRRRATATDVVLSYARTEQVAVGQVGAIEVQRVTAGIIGRPARRIEISLAPAASRDVAHLTAQQATTYLVTTAVTATFTRFLSLQASYQAAWERAKGAQVDPLTYERRVFMLRLVASAPRSASIFAPQNPPR